MRQCTPQAEVSLGAPPRNGLWRSLWKLTKREPDERTHHCSGLCVLRMETAKAALCPRDKPGETLRAPKTKALKHKARARGRKDSICTARSQHLRWVVCVLEKEAHFALTLAKGLGPLHGEKCEGWCTAGARPPVGRRGRETSKTLAPQQRAWASRPSEIWCGNRCDMPFGARPGLHKR